MATVPSTDCTATPGIADALRVPLNEEEQELSAGEKTYKCCADSSLKYDIVRLNSSNSNNSNNSNSTKYMKLEIYTVTTSADVGSKGLTLDPEPPRTSNTNSEKDSEKITQRELENIKEWNSLLSQATSEYEKDIVAQFQALDNGDWVSRDDTDLKTMGSEKKSTSSGGRALWEIREWQEGMLGKRT